MLERLNELKNIMGTTAKIYMRGGISIFNDSVLAQRRVGREPEIRIYNNKSHNYNNCSYIHRER